MFYLKHFKANLAENPKLQQVVPIHPQPSSTTNPPSGSLRSKRKANSAKDFASKLGFPCCFGHGLEVGMNQNSNVFLFC